MSFLKSPEFDPLDVFKPILQNQISTVGFVAVVIYSLTLSSYNFARDSSLNIKMLLTSIGNALLAVLLTVFVIEWPYQWQPLLGKQHSANHRNIAILAFLAIVALFYYTPFFARIINWKSSIPQTFLAPRPRTTREPFKNASLITEASLFDPKWKHNVSFNSSSPDYYDVSYNGKTNYPNLFRNDKKSNDFKIPPPVVPPPAGINFFGNTTEQESHPHPEIYDRSSSVNFSEIAPFTSSVGLGSESQYKPKHESFASTGLSIESVYKPKHEEKLTQTFASIGLGIESDYKTKPKHDIEGFGKLNLKRDTITGELVNIEGYGNLRRDPKTGELIQEKFTELKRNPVTGELYNSH
jgi:hypothetical protein